MLPLTFLCLLLAVLSRSVMSAEFTYCNTTTVGNTRYSDSDKIDWPYNPYIPIANVPGELLIYDLFIILKKYIKNIYIFQNLCRYD